MIYFYMPGTHFLQAKQNHGTEMKAGGRWRQTGHWRKLGMRDLNGHFVSFMRTVVFPYLVEYTVEKILSEYLHFIPCFCDKILWRKQLQRGLVCCGSWLGLQPTMAGMTRRLELEETAHITFVVEMQRGSNACLFTLFTVCTPGFLYQGINGFHWVTWVFHINEIPTSMPRGPSPKTSQVLLSWQLARTINATRKGEGRNYLLFAGPFYIGKTGLGSSACNSPSRSFVSVLDKFMEINE